MIMWSVGILPVCTPYRAGVGYDCLFLGASVQNVQQKDMKTAPHLCYLLTPSCRSRATENVQMAMANTQILQALVNSAWRANTTIQNNPSNPLHPTIIKGSIPILWFGDLDAYEHSELRVVTVGINPSRMEFGKKVNSTYVVNPTLRFPSLGSAVPSFSNYSAAMAQYFSNNPLKAWFWPNEAALNAYGSSYGGKMSPVSGTEIIGTGLHIDVVAPIATVPWGKLKPVEQNGLSNLFQSYFNQLVAALDPHVLIVPIKMGNYQNFNVPCSITCTRTIRLKSRMVTVNKQQCVIGGKPRLLINGWNGSTPFPFADRQTIFSAVK